MQRTFKANSPERMALMVSPLKYDTILWFNKERLYTWTIAGYRQRINLYKIGKGKLHNTLKLKALKYK